MHIYISQRALEEGVNVIIEEMVPFSYMMLREGYDAESIVQFLESAEDEDFDFIYEQADSEMLSESVVDEMSDEEVLLYEEQIGLVINHFGLMEGLLKGLSLATKLKAMTPAALKQFIKNNAAARRLAQRLGLLKKAPAKKIKVKVKQQPGVIKKSQVNKNQPPKKTPPKNKPGVVNKGNIAKAGLGAAGLGLGAGLLNDKLSGDGTDDSTTTANNTDSSKTDTDKNGNDTTPPKTPKKKGTPWWIARNQSLIRKPDVPFRTEVALKRFRNPSSNKDYSVISSEYEYLVDYLIAEGHAETVEEATYVMEQMGEEVAVEILNEVI